MNYLFLDFTAQFLRTLPWISVSKGRKIVNKICTNEKHVKSQCEYPQKWLLILLLVFMLYEPSNFCSYPYEWVLLFWWLLMTLYWIMFSVINFSKLFYACSFICFLISKALLFLIGHLTIQFLYSLQHFIFRPELYSEELPLQHKSAAL